MYIFLAAKLPHSCLEKQCPSQQQRVLFMHTPSRLMRTLQHTSSAPPNELNEGKQGWQIRHAFLYQQTPMFITGFVHKKFIRWFFKIWMAQVNMMKLPISRYHLVAVHGQKEILVHESTGIHLIVARADPNGHPILTSGTSFYNLTHDGMYLVDFLNLDESFSWNTNIAPDRNTPLHAYSHPNGRIGVVGKGQNNAYIAQSFTFSADSDGDGIPDLFDTHIYVPSSSDWDNDGLLNSIDNCPYVWNLDQANNDNDLYGDACDTDIDGDDITNTIPIDLTSASNIDKCPYVFANS